MKGLRKLSKLDWAGYFKGLGITPSKKLVIGTPKFFSALDGLRTKLKPAQWSAYFTYHVVAATSFARGELLGQQYAAKYFPPAAKQSASSVVDALVTVMGEELGKLDWMTEATRKTAQATLAKVVRMVGYPDKWRTYDFDVKRGDFAGNE